MYFFHADMHQGNLFVAVMEILPVDLELWETRQK